MNTREIAQEYRLAHWAQVVRERSESGLSIKAYCQQIGICTNTYFYWQRKLRKAACNELALRTSEAEQSIVPIGWTRLEATEPPLAEAGITIEVGGCRVTATCATDTALLAQVCRTLKSL